MIGRLFKYWVYGGLLAGIMILALIPLLADGWSTTFTAIFVFATDLHAPSVRGTRWRSLPALY